MEGDHFEDTDVDGRIIKMGFQEWKVMDWFKDVQGRDRLWVVVNITKEV